MKIDFTETNEVRNTELFQFDYGQTLEISGVELPEKFEMHFEYGDISLSVDGIYSNGKGTVKVPDTLLDGLRSKFSAWLYVEDGKSGKTIKTVEFILGRRKKPSDYPCNPSEIAEVKTLAEYVKENADKVATAEKVGQDLLQRAENGEFDGADGKDYILTETDKAEIAESIPVDDTLSATSTKPLQNKVVKEHFDKVQDILADGKLKDIICFTSEQEAIDGHYLEYLDEDGKFKQGLLDKEFYIVIIATDQPIDSGKTDAFDVPVYYWGIYIVTKQGTVDVGHLYELLYLETNLSQQLAEKVDKTEYDKTIKIITTLVQGVNDTINEVRNERPDKESIYPIDSIVQFVTPVNERYDEFTLRIDTANTNYGTDLVWKCIDWNEKVSSWQRVDNYHNFIYCCKIVRVPDHDYRIQFSGARYILNDTKITRIGYLVGKNMNETDLVLENVGNIGSNPDSGTVKETGLDKDDTIKNAAHTTCYGISTKTGTACVRPYMKVVPTTGGQETVVYGKMVTYTYPEV